MDANDRIADALEQEYALAIRKMREAQRRRTELCVGFVGGEESKITTLIWPPRWRVEHITCNDRHFEEKVGGTRFDILFVLTRWTTRESRKQLAKLRDKINNGDKLVVWWDRPGIGELCKLCNFAVRRDIDDDEVIKHPPEILKAKTVREVVAFFRRAQPDLTPEKILDCCFAVRHVAPPLRAMKDDRAVAAAVHGALRAITADKIAKVDKQLDEAAKLRTAKPKSQPEPQPPQATETPYTIEEKTTMTPPTTPAPPAAGTHDDAYKAITGLLSDAKRIDVWKRDEMEMLVCAWQEARDDAEALFQNFRTLGGKRSVTSVLFQLQRIAAAAGKPLSQKLVKQLRELSVDDRKKSSLSIVEFVERKAGSTATLPTADDFERYQSADGAQAVLLEKDREFQDALKKRLAEQASSPKGLVPGDSPPSRLRPDVNFGMRVEYIVRGVELGMKSKEAAYDEIAALVRQ